MTRDLDHAATTRAVTLIPLVLAMLAMIGPFSIDTPFPAFAQMGEALDVTAGELQLVVTAYMLAFAAMSVFHGPLSDAGVAAGRASGPGAGRRRLDDREPHDHP